MKSPIRRKDEEPKEPKKSSKSSPAQNKVNNKKDKTSLKEQKASALPVQEKEVTKKSSEYQEVENKYTSYDRAVIFCQTSLVDKVIKELNSDLLSVAKPSEYMAIIQSKYKGFKIISDISCARKTKELVAVFVSKAWFGTINSSNHPFPNLRHPQNVVPLSLSTEGAVLDVLRVEKNKLMVKSDSDQSSAKPQQEEDKTRN